METHFKAAEQEKMNKVETIITRGKNIMSMAGIESTFTKYQSRPNRLRIEGEFQGNKVIQSYNGETAWIFAPSMGIPEPKEMSEVELKAILNQAEFENPLWDYQKKGNRLELTGVSEDGKASHVTLTTESEEQQHFFINRKTHMITSIKTNQIMGGSEKEIEIQLKDYKLVKGIPVSHYVVTKIDGEEVSIIQIEKVEFNKRIDPSLFEKPGNQ